MKIAHDQQGQSIEASESAPKEANCPYCDGKVSLRSRNASDKSGKTYFWRHVRLNDLNCPGRSYPYRMHVRNSSKLNLQQGGGKGND